MRNAISIITILLLFGCGKRQPILNPEEAGSPPPAVLYVFMNDITASAKHLDLERDELLELLRSDTSRSCLQVAALRVQSDSWKQTPYISRNICAGLEPVNGDIYERAAAEARNAERLASFYKQVEEAVDKLSAYLLRERNQQQTDINGAVRLAQQLIQQPNFKDWQVRLVIISDLKQDLANREKLQPFSFADKVEIFVIGKAANADVIQLFPSNSPVLLPAFRAQFLQ